MKIHLISAMVALGTVALAANCGGSSLGSGPAASGCSYTLTGAVNGSFTCQVLVSSDGAATTMTVVPFQNGGVIQGVSSVLVLHTGISFEITSYSPSTVKQGEMIVSGSGTAVWDMSAHATDPENHPDRGSFALNVFATGNQIPLVDGAVWVHAQGNLTGTLPAETNTGASGDISVNVTFTDSAGSAAALRSSIDGGTITDAGTIDAGTDAGTGDAGTADAGTSGTSAAACTLTFTGGIQVTSPCSVIATNSNNRTGVTIEASGNATGTGAAAFSNGGASFGFAGAFTTGTFDATTAISADLFSSGQAENIDGTNWTEGFSSGSSANQLGSFSWTITSIGTPTTTPSIGLTTYDGVHGSFTGTLVSQPAPDGGIGPDVNLSISF
jgi:hypothetical protein